MIVGTGSSRWMAAGCGVAVAFGVVACRREPSPEPPAPSAAPLAASSAARTATSIDYVIAPAGKATIDMPAPNERIKGETAAARGVLHVDGADLSATRGDVYIDLDTLTTHTFGDPDKDATQTHHAHTWLQIDEKMPDGAVRERNRWAHFAIRSIDGLSAPELAKVAVTRVGEDDVRSVSLVAHGDIEVHSLPAKGLASAPLDVRFHFPAGAPATTKATAIDIVSRSPFTITLAEHDVKPRDAEGILAQKAFGLLGTKVAEVANVSVDLVARPAG